MRGVRERQRDRERQRERDRERETERERQRERDRERADLSLGEMHPIGSLDLDCTFEALLAIVSDPPHMCSGLHASHSGLDGHRCLPSPFFDLAILSLEEPSPGFTDLIRHITPEDGPLPLILLLCLSLLLSEIFHLTDHTSA
jgi:hypothetical protein